MSSSQSSKVGRVSQPSRSTATPAPSFRFARPKPLPEVKPADIHDLRMEITRVKGETKLKQTQLNRLKEHIIDKIDAINRTVKQQNDESGPKHGSTIGFITQSVAGAENALEKLKIELEEAIYDDRTAFYREAEEEIRATYLEFERVKAQVITSREEALCYEAKLKEVDYRACEKNAEDLNRSINGLKALNHSLREKWRAYHVKMEKMKIEARIAENRAARRPLQETIDAAPEEYNEEADQLNSLAEQLEAMDTEFQQKVERLNGIIDDQRRKIVRHLVGRDEEEEEDQGE
jgi:hypothetical protein